MRLQVNRQGISVLVFCIALVLISVSAAFADEMMPEDFVRLNETMPDAQFDVRYFNGNNFVGEQIDGYFAPVVILSDPAAKALAKAQNALKPFGFGFKFFDGYRPQRAVDHFVRWAKDLKDTKNKAQFYPQVSKKNLFRDGYIAEKSGHSRGSTVDLTLVDLATGNELDMGTHFDFFGLQSWPDNDDMPGIVRANRALLRNVMVRFGFKPYDQEWWHFTLAKEPYPNTYFDFVVE